MNNLIFSCIIFMMPVFLHAQIKGAVYDVGGGKKEPLSGAVVGWVGTTKSVIADEKGEFSIHKTPETNRLYVSYLGLENDTVVVKKQTFITFKLKLGSMEIQEVVVRDKESATTLKRRDPQLTELITARELTKAACCNLSESFETNPAIDASFTDAVTGTRQIRLLGLDGPYSYYTRGNIPTLGGIASVLGLQLIPGNWIQSIQLTKGSGSVINGFESIAGQVNYELRKPDDKENIHAQLYGNAMGRLEQSMVYNQKISDTWASNLMLYARQQVGRPDWNKDGFVDISQGKMWIAQNTWKFNGTKGLESQFGIKYAYNDQNGGQMSALDAEPADSNWLAYMNTKRFEYWHKMGYVFKNAVARSIGMQISYTYHDQTANFGLPTVPTYGGIENSFYANVIFQDILGNTNHNYKVGASYKYVNLDETYKATLYQRKESIPGVFAEYTYLFKESLSVVGGLRLDAHNIYGAFFTPRLHIRYEPFLHHTFRFNVGKAYRTPNVFADNIGSMASNRIWNIELGDPDIPYNGLEQEQSINTGISYAYSFEIDYRPGSFRAEYFYTTFQNQLVKDWDASANTLNFYNLTGQSFAHSAQVQFDYEVIQRLTARVAYRFVQAQTEYKSIGLDDQPFIAKHRFFINMGYKSRKFWKFDVTVNRMSPQRLPSTASNPVAYQLEDKSPAFTTLNFQIAKEFKERLEVHFGMENAFNFRMENPIVSADNPFNPSFDASMIWGPIMGRTIYAGIRLNLLKKK